MKQLIPKGLGLVLCLAVVTLAVVVVLVPMNPEDRALSLLDQQGYTVAAIRLLSDRLEKLDPQTSWDEAKKVYDKLVELAARIESASQVPQEVKREVAQIEARAQIVMGKAKGDRALAEGDLAAAFVAFSKMEEGIEGLAEPVGKYKDLLSLDYYRKRIPTLAMAPSTAELEEVFSQLFKWAIDLAKGNPEERDKYLMVLSEVRAIALDPSVPPELAAIACQYASLMAYLTQDREQAKQLITKEAELAPGFPPLASLPPNLHGELAQAVLYWEIERARELGRIAFDRGDYKAALEAFWQMKKDAEQSGESLKKFAALFDRDYFEKFAKSLVKAQEQPQQLSADEFEKRLSSLFEWALAVTGAEQLTPGLKDRLQAEFGGLEALVTDLGVSEAKSIVLNELAFLAFVLGKGGDSIRFITQWVKLQNQLAKAQGIYTLQELAEHPEVAKFTIQGNGTFTSVDIVFTYVPRPIVVLIRPMVFHYVGTGIRYQDMAVYYVEVIEISEPRTITVPALCLDFTAEVPAEGLSDYEIVEIGDWVERQKVNKEQLMRRLYTLQFIEGSRERLQESGIHGPWDVLLEFPEELWERLRADIVWNLTNPENWQDIRQDLVSQLQIYWMTDHLVERLPFHPEWSSQERKTVAVEVTWLLKEGGEDWERALQNIAVLIELMLPPWQNPDQLQQLLIQILKAEDTPDEIRELLSLHLQLIYWQILENHDYDTPLGDIRGYLERHLQDLLDTLERFGTDSEAQVDAVLNLLEQEFGLNLTKEGVQ